MPEGYKQTVHWHGNTATSIFTLCHNILKIPSAAAEAAHTANRAQCFAPQSQTRHPAAHHRTRQVGQVMAQAVLFSVLSHWNQYNKRWVQKICWPNLSLPHHFWRKDPEFKNLDLCCLSFDYRPTVHLSMWWLIYNYNYILYIIYMKVGHHSNQS